MNLRYFVKLNGEKVLQYQTGVEMPSGMVMGDFTWKDAPEVREVKEESERRTFMLYKDGDKWDFAPCYMICHMPDESIKVMEIKDDEIVVSKEQVIEAISISYSNYVEEVCKRLGFKE